MSNIKQQANEARGALQQGIYKVIYPFVKLLIRMGVTPNMVSTIGFLGNLGGAVIIVIAAMRYNPLAPDYLPLMWAGITIILSSLFDMLDGQVARIGGMTSTFGAMYDSVLDRYSELVTLGAIAYYMIDTAQEWGALITFLALVGSIMVSYVRARAEGLNIECKIGFMQRPERVVVTVLGLLLAGTIGSLVLLIVAMGIIALFANLTAFARIDHCRRALKNRK